MSPASTDSPGERRAIVVARTAAILAVAGGVSVLFGWFFGLRTVTQPLPAVASMKPNTALGIVGAGVALWLLVVGTRTRVAVLLGLSLSMLGLVTLGEDAFGWSLGIDQILFVDDNPVATSAPGRMAPATAVCFAALGLSLAVSARSPASWIPQVPALVTLVVSSIAVFGYLYGVGVLYGLGASTTMAVHTGVLLAVLAVGVLCARPGVGVAALVVSAELEGIVARRFLAAGIAVPTLLGWLPLAGTRSDLYGAEFGVALMVVGTIILLSTVIVVGGASLRRLRQRSEAALRAANDELQYVVDRRTAELAHREKEFRLVVEEAQEAFIAMNAHGRIVGVNGKTEEMFGWPRDALIGRQLSDTIVPARYRRAHLEGLQRFVAGGEGRMLDRLVQIEALHRDGHEFPVAISMTAVWFDDQWRFNAFIQDLTPMRQAAIHLKAALSEKEALLKEVHHRVKNNLQVISSVLRLQAGSVQDAAAVEALRQSDERVMSMALLHENLYRSDNLGRVDFDRYLHVLTDELVKTYGGAGGRVRIDVQCDLPHIDIDRAVPLGLLVNELVTNALKHAFPGGRKGCVSVAITHHADQGQVIVKDDGVGFPARREGASASVGLTIVEALSRQLGGRGEFRQGAGTEFALAFPMPGSHQHG